MQNAVLLLEENWPGPLHGAHASAPKAALRPAAQVLHPELSPFGTVPGSHATQVAFPAVETLPLAQGRQTVPSYLLYVPAAHLCAELSHDAAPGALLA